MYITVSFFLGFVISQYVLTFIYLSILKLVNSSHEINKAVGKCLGDISKANEVIKNKNLIHKHIQFSIQVYLYQLKAIFFFLAVEHHISDKESPLSMISNEIKR